MLLHRLTAHCALCTLQGVRAVVTLNEEFEVFISSDQYKVHLPAVNLHTLI
jgi:hypothetical protein